MKESSLNESNTKYVNISILKINQNKSKLICENKCQYCSRKMEDKNAIKEKKITYSKEVSPRKRLIQISSFLFKRMNPSKEEKIIINLKAFKCKLISITFTVSNSFKKND